MTFNTTGTIIIEKFPYIFLKILLKNSKILIFIKDFENFNKILKIP